MACSCNYELANPLKMNGANKGANSCLLTKKQLPLHRFFNNIMSHLFN